MKWKWVGNGLTRSSSPRRDASDSFMARWCEPSCVFLYLIYYTHFLPPYYEYLYTPQGNKRFHQANRNFSNVEHTNIPTLTDAQLLKCSCQTCGKWLHIPANPHKFAKYRLLLLYVCNRDPCKSVNENSINGCIAMLAYFQKIRMATKVCAGQYLA